MTNRSVTSVTNFKKVCQATSTVITGFLSTFVTLSRLSRLHRKKIYKKTNLSQRVYKCKKCAERSGFKYRGSNQMFAPRPQLLELPFGNHAHTFSSVAQWATDRHGVGNVSYLESQVSDMPFRGVFLLSIVYPASLDRTEWLYRWR